MNKAEQDKMAIKQIKWIPNEGVLTQHLHFVLSENKKSEIDNTEAHQGKILIVVFLKHNDILLNLI